MEERLSKLIALAGIASRREADRLIQDGRVTVNGEVIHEPGHRVNVDDDYVKVDGRLITQLPANSYIVVNKPSGVLASRTDSEGRATVVSMMKANKGRLIPVGKLEADDEGVMLLTSDGKLALGLADPRTGISRGYLLKVRGVPDEKVLNKLRTGVPLEDGRSLPMEVRLLSVTNRNAWMQVTTREARNRLLKRVMLRLRHPVLKLKRTSFGPLSVKGLAPGTFRKLTEDEVKTLKGLAENPPGLPEPIYASDADIPPAPVSRPVVKRNVPSRNTRAGRDEEEGAPRSRAGRPASGASGRGGKPAPRTRSRTP